jgi:acyl-coenzyme A synthetase/AMP-(fatty) acid ligase
MLKVSGIFVAPAEIENCLLQHEAVLECAVIGNDAGDGLIKPKAFVVLREEHKVRTGSGPGSPSGQPAWGSGSDQVNDTDLNSQESLIAELQAFVKNQLAPYKYPRWIEFVPSLPKNDRGKIDRKLLKQK